jgi:hypothetical protein
LLRSAFTLDRLFFTVGFDLSEQIKTVKIELHSLVSENVGVLGLVGIAIF